ncbi:hypothetical protein [Candidatus Enterococcus mansonii]|nr:hypothetical protein [Enterococcus sp. 4G2_DIV0659]
MIHIRTRIRKNLGIEPLSRTMLDFNLILFTFLLFSINLTEIIIKTNSTPLIGTGLVTSTPESIEFSQTPDGRLLMITVVNGVKQETIKEVDGTLTANGQNYHPYDKSIEEFQSTNVKQNNEQYGL